ncbi:MAG: bi-domain-containing oxidoreductase [Planctomycetes bacterium]|nr:bi-domain-containing oxidoreductase [Planctomycetota bacterium]
MKQVLFRQGKPVVEDVPAPTAEPGTLLVRVSHSCISTGTELSGMTAGGVPLWRRALSQPDKVLKAVKMAAKIGVRQTAELIESRVGAGAATGYAASGVVLEAGAGIDDLRPGDAVACAGAEWAHHAQFVRVPRHLVAPIPPGVSHEEACTATLGAIALHGVRRANPTLGETFVVLGLGLIGQLVTQVLKANGCRVLGFDPDLARTDTARELGMPVALPDEEQLAIDRVHRLTGGHGADGVIITAASPSDRVAANAFAMCRRKGRVVLVGDVGLHLNRADFYAKEIDFLISCSYGPGRYDARYETGGLDYPLGYVRWTEGRNIEHYLRMLADRSVSVRPLIGATFPVAHAEEAYAVLRERSPRPLVVLLSYPAADDAAPPARVVTNPNAAPCGRDRVRLAVIGAGLFAREMHLPNLRRLGERVYLRAVMSRTGHVAADAARRFGVATATTDLAAVLGDDQIDAVLITTRHDTHAGLALAALRAGKHVLVEKPLTLTRDELAEIESFFHEQEQAHKPAPLLLTGFNRRFSPHARRLRELLAGRQGPMMIHYRFNAPRLAPDHWVHGPEGGGRNLGEACHIYDLFTALTGARAVGVTAQPIAADGAVRGNENFTATVRFDDGSVATLSYTTLGHPDLPKERMELFADGVAYVLDDYRTLTVAGSRKAGVNTRVVDKGHAAELDTFITAVRVGGDWPIPLWQQAQATRIAFDVEDAIRAGDARP